MTKIQIKHRHTEAVIFECEQEAGMTLRHALEKAVSAKTNLGSADLRRANLRGANLGGANLGDAYLYGANLGDAYLRGANLYGANLGDANLRCAYLRGANLGGAYLGSADLRGADLGDANLGGKKLVGDRPFMQIGPIGSRSDFLLAFITDASVQIKAGCFTGTVDEFLAAVEKEHADNTHAAEYRAAVAFIQKHAELWTPKIGGQS